MLPAAHGPDTMLLLFGAKATLSPPLPNRIVCAWLMGVFLSATPIETVQHLGPDMG